MRLFIYLNLSFLMLKRGGGGGGWGRWVVPLSLLWHLPQEGAEAPGGSLLGVQVLEGGELEDPRVAAEDGEGLVEPRGAKLQAPAIRSVRPIRGFWGEDFYVYVFFGFFFCRGGVSKHCRQNSCF